MARFVLNPITGQLDLVGSSGGGGSSNAFGVIDVPAGTNPSAGTPNDTLNLTSSDSSIIITGNAGTKTVDLKADENSFSIMQPDHGTNPTASGPNNTLTFTSSDSSVTITGNSVTDTLDFTATGTGFIPEYIGDPVSPAAQQAWVSRALGHPAGTPIGLLLALTYTGSAYTYTFSYKTLEGPIVRTSLS
jgi:hypothetical protein